MKQFLKWLFHHSAWGLTFLRVVLGCIFLYTGFFKITQMDFAVLYFAQKGFPLPQVIGPFISVLELCGGALLLAGLFTRYLGLIFAGEFLVAMLVIALQKGVVVARFEFMILTTCIVLATQGAGRLAIDRPGRPWEPFSERRRRQDRFRWEGEARMVAPHDIQGRLVNINQSGASVTGVASHTEVGQPVEVEIRLHQLELARGPLKLRGHVRWVEGEDEHRTVGIQFDEPDPVLEKLFDREVERET